MKAFDFGWTKKLKLNRSRDPLGLRPLKVLEDHFLPGITTQTQRLRYYSFLTWAWRRMRNGDVDSQGFLLMEKLLTLITQSNHQEDNSVPYGTRNTRSGSDFLREQNRKRSISLNEYIDFGYGGRNKIGYGTYYYRNPLRLLRIVWYDEKKGIELSKVGESIARLFEAKRGKRTFFSDKVPKGKLRSLHQFCLCNDVISMEERNIWRMVFFGFTESKTPNHLVLDKQTFSRFQRGKLQFPEDPKRWLGTRDFDLEAGHRDLEEDLRIIGRRGTLFLIMKIVEATQPEANEIDQIARDTLYFRQFMSGSNKVKRIGFGKLESLRVLWEVYVHNLYLISVLEDVFTILLESLETKPMGASLHDIMSSLKLSLIENKIERLGFDSQDLGNVETRLERELQGKTSLKTRVNERKLFFDVFSSETHEERLANLVALLCLLKYRFLSFSEPQIEVLRCTEKDLQSVAPTYLYKYLVKGPMEPLIERLLRLVANRHRFIASIRYKAGTRCWLITEEDDVFFHYGKRYRWRAYRESKWRNVVELLCDLGLLEKKDTTFKISRTGRSWLRRTE